MNTGLSGKKKVQKILLAVCIILLLVSLVEINLLNVFKEPVIYSKENTALQGEEQGPIKGISVEFASEKAMLESLRVAFSEVPENGSFLISIFEGDTLLYQGTKAFADIEIRNWVEFTIMLPIDEDSVYRIEFYAPEELNPQMIYTDDGDREPLISFGYSDNLDVVDKILCSLFVAIVCGVIIFFIVKADRIMELIKKNLSEAVVWRGRIKISSIIVMCLAEVSLLASGEDIAPVFLAIFPLAAFLCTNWLENRRQDFEKMWREPVAKIILPVLALLGAFGLVGSKCFIYPLNMHVTVGGIFVFLLTAIWMFPVNAWVIMSIDKYSETLSADKRSPVVLMGIALAIIAVGGIYYVRAFNPCISSPDTTYCMERAFNSVTGLTDWHPPFYIMWLRAILKIIPSVYMVVFVQYAFFAFVFIEGLFLLYRRGLSLGWLVTITALTVLNCSNMVNLTTIWKDIPYTICLLWLTVIIARILLVRGIKWLAYAELAVALVLTCFFRQNGIVPYLLLSVFLVIFLRKNWKVWGAVIVACVMVLFIRFPLYSYFEVQRNPNGGEYIGLGQDILGVYYNGGNISEETMEIVLVLSRGDMEMFQYTPYYSEASYDLDVSKAEFIKAYLDTFIRNPILMTRAIVCRNDGIWNIFMGEDGFMGLVAYTGTQDGAEGWYSLWPVRKENILTERIGEWVGYSSENPLLNCIEWRSGIWFWVVVVAFIMIWWKKMDKKLLLVYVPIGGHIVSLILSTGWADFRYYWPVNLMGLFLVLLTLTFKKKEEII